MAFVPFGDPVEVTIPDEEEEARRRAEAEAVLGPTPALANIRVPLPGEDPAAQEAERRQRQVDLADPIDGALPGAMVSTPQAPEGLRQQQADADRVGAAYRAAGGQPAPSSERVAPQRGHAGTQRILSFDPEVRTGRPPAAVRVDDSRTRGAASPVQASAGRSLSSPASPPASGVSPSQPSGPAASSPGVDRARLLELARAKTGGGGRQPVDHTGADVADAVRRPLHAIGAALSAAAGRTPGRFRSLGDQSRRREAQAQQLDARGMQQESAARLAEMRLQQQGEEAAARREDRVADREIRAQGVASLDRYRQQMADLRRQADEGLISQRQAAAEAIRLRSQMEGEERDPASERSAQVRAEFQQEIELLPERLRSQLGPVNLENVSAEGVSHMRDRLRQLGILRNVGSGRGTSGGGGNPLRRTAPAWWSGSDDEWRALGATGQRQEIQRHARSGGEDEQGTEIMPGVRSPMDLPASEAQSMRNGIAQAGASAANIRGLGSVHQRYGGLSARISREAEAEITPRLVVASGMVANLGNTGTINESEVPRINAALPNPADLQQMTFGTFQRRMETWQNLLESGVRSQLAARGVDDAGIRRVLQTIRTGSFSAGGGGGGQRAQQPPADTLRVRRPDGSTGTIPRRLEQQARDRGWEVLDG